MDRKSGQEYPNTQQVHCHLWSPHTDPATESLPGSLYLGLKHVMLKLPYAVVSIGNFQKSLLSTKDLRI